MIEIKTCANCKYNKYGQLDGPPCPECKFVDAVFPNKWQPIDPEQIEGCEFCRGESELKIGYVEICIFEIRDKKHLTVDVYDDESGLIGLDEESFPVNYCPMCGKRLVEE